MYSFLTGNYFQCLLQVEVNWSPEYFRMTVGAKNARRCNGIFIISLDTNFIVRDKNITALNVKLLSFFYVKTIPSEIKHSSNNTLIC